MPLCRIDVRLPLKSVLRVYNFLLDKSFITIILWRFKTFKLYKTP